MVTPEGKRVTSETRGLLVPMPVVATSVVQTGRETVDSEPIEDGDVDWHDLLDESGMGQPASAAMRHQVFCPDDDAAADDKLREAIVESGNVAHVAREAKVGRQTVYGFLSGAVPHPKTRKKIESALRRIGAVRA